MGDWKVPGDLFHNSPTLWTVGEGNQVRTIKTLPASQLLLLQQIFM